MSTIKIFRGTVPPLLKKGEWASDGNFAYLGMEGGEYKVFQGLFDLGVNQAIVGFGYSSKEQAIVVPSGTPFSKLQKLFDNLPKNLKYNSTEKASIDIKFEDGTFVNDLGANLVLRDYSYQINILALSDTTDDTEGTWDKPVVFQSDKAIEIYNSSVNFSDIRFEYSDPKKGALSLINSSVTLDDCCFDAKVSQDCVLDKGYNKIVFSDTYFKMFQDITDSILLQATVGSNINIACCKSDSDYRPKTIARSLSGGIIIVGNVEDLKIEEKSTLYMPHGGVEIHGGFVTEVDGNLSISVPTKLSQLENDLEITGNYEDLENKPITISEEQAESIESNNNKNSYPEEDSQKLANIEENATNGADWNSNIKNKPELLDQIVAVLDTMGINSLAYSKENSSITIGLEDEKVLNLAFALPGTTETETQSN